MSTQHTPGRVEHDMRGYPHSDVRSVSGRKIANTWGTGHPKTAEAYKRRTEEDRANARRLVACWNACEGLSTEALERLGTLDRAKVELDVIRTKAIAQRDELLAALHQIVGHDLPDENAIVAVARAAISKATGSAA